VLVANGIAIDASHACSMRNGGQAGAAAPVSGMPVTSPAMLSPVEKFHQFPL